MHRPKLTPLNNIERIEGFKQMPVVTAFNPGERLKKHFTQNYGNQQRCAIRAIIHDQKQPF